MGFFAFAILGILTGIIARIILPGKQVGGWFVAILLGLHVAIYLILACMPATLAVPTPATPAAASALRSFQPA